MGRGQVRERASHLGLDPAPPPAQASPDRPHLTGDLGQFLRPQHDQRDHEDDQQLRRAERHHFDIKSTGAPASRLSDVSSPGSARPENPWPQNRPLPPPRSSARREALTLCPPAAPIPRTRSNSKEAHAADRPDPHEHPPDDERSRDRTEEAAVLGIPPVVPHHEVMVGRHFATLGGPRTAGDVATRVGRDGASRKPGLAKRLPVDPDAPAGERDRLARQSDDAFPPGR